MSTGPLPAMTRSVGSSSRALGDDYFGDECRYTLESQKPGAFYAVGHVSKWIPSPSAPAPAAVTVASTGSGVHFTTLQTKP